MNAVPVAGILPRMARFPDTQWSLIRATGENPTARHAAFSELARQYRPAIVAFFRARVSAADAEDATQSFLAASFEHRWWARADAQVGSFRAFLLMLLHRHGSRLRHAHDTADPLDATFDPPDGAPEIDRQFDARFALLLTTRALEALRTRYRERGREALFVELARLLGSPPAQGQLQETAAALGLVPNTLTVELKRLRSRLHDALREELRQLCASEAAFETEWSALQAVLRGS